MHGTVDLKNIHNLKVESYVFIQSTFLGLQAREAASQVTLRELLQGGYRGRGRSPVVFVLSPVRLFVRILEWVALSFSRGSS